MFAPELSGGLAAHCVACGGQSPGKQSGCRTVVSAYDNRGASSGILSLPPQAGVQCQRSEGLERRGSSP